MRISDPFRRSSSDREPLAFEPWFENSAGRVLVARTSPDEALGHWKRLKAKGER